MISPDLTLNDKTPPADLRRADAATTSASSTAASSMAIAESPKQAGPHLGRHQRRSGAGDARRRARPGRTSRRTFQDLPPWGTVGSIEPSRYDAATAYLAIDFHQVDNRDPFVYRTTDFGETWKPITNGIPPSMLATRTASGRIRCAVVCCISAPRTAIYVSFDDGGNWQPLQMNLPHAPVYWLDRAGARSTIWSSRPTAAASGSSTISRRCGS